VAYSYSSLGGVHISVRESMTNGYCDARPVVIFPATEHDHCPSARTHLPSRKQQKAELTCVTCQDGKSANANSTRPN